MYYSEHYKCVHKEIKNQFSLNLHTKKKKTYLYIQPYQPEFYIRFTNMLLHAKLSGY